jgi:hypothetical protein
MQSKLREVYDGQERLRRLEADLDANKTPGDEDVRWLHDLVQGVQDLPPPLTRLLARANPSTPTGQPTSDRSDRIGESSSKWWAAWERIAKCEAGSHGRSLFAEKQKLLVELSEEISAPASYTGLTGVERDLWYRWRVRVKQAQEMAESLKPFLLPLKKEFTDQEYYLAWRTVGRWLEQAPDEVFCLFTSEWKLAHGCLKEWDDQVIEHRIATEKKAKRHAIKQKMNSTLSSDRSDEQARADKKWELGINLVRQMVEPTPVGPQSALVPSTAYPATGMSGGYEATGASNQGSQYSHSGYSRLSGGR